MNRIVLLLLLLVLAVVLAVLGGLGRHRAARSTAPDRTVVLRMRNYAFFAAGDSNPTLVFRPHERVRFVLRNDEDTRVVHDFRFVGFEAPPESAIVPGETRAIEVTMPVAGRYGYTCHAHAGMGGVLLVAPDAGAGAAP
ncbi:MAG: cupredoxin domain-containing protein [Hyphomicrobiales bacterium]